MADFVANSFYRNIEKKNQESKTTVGMLKSFLCNGDVFDFSESRDIKLLLWLLKVYKKVDYYEKSTYNI